MKDYKKIESVKTNGFTLDEKAANLLDVWEKYLYSRLPVREFTVFYWSETCAFADVRLSNGHYGSFNIYLTGVHFNGHTCDNEEFYVFSQATLNDNCYSGRLKID